MAEGKKPFNGIRPNNPEWTEARPIPTGLDEHTEVTERQMKITFLTEEPPNLDYIEKVFAVGLQVDPSKVHSVQVTETVVTTYTKPKYKL